MPNELKKEYFPHDYGTRNKKKMAVLLHEQKAKGYGLFWIIVEMLHENSDNWMELEELTYIAIEKESGESADYVKEFIEKCIGRYKVFHQDGNRFTTERVLSHIDTRLEIKEKRSQAGRASAEARKQKGANDEHVLNKNEQTATKETKGKETKGKNYLRPKGLTAAFAADTTEVKDMKREYDELVTSLDGKADVDCWTAIRSFVKDRRPVFIEPYVDLWNLFALTHRLIKQPIRITDHRRKKLDTRVREPGFDFVAALQAIKASAFLKGKNDNGWKVDFEFIIHSEENYTKILEGKYE